MATLSPGALAQAPALVPDSVQTLRSTLLGEERRFRVHLPRGYDPASGIRYPVLYLTDAETQFGHTVETTEFLARNGRIPRLIVVGVDNTDRSRDLTPSRPSAEDNAARGALPTAGGADRFLAFFRQELIPQVEKSYLCLPFRVFAGHSFGGLFGVHAFFTSDTFQAAIAASPTLAWDGKLPVRETRQHFQGLEQDSRALFIALGDEGPLMQEGFDAMKSALKSQKASGFRWDMQQWKDEDHGSILMRAHDRGLRYVFSDWPVPTEPATGNFSGSRKDLEAHFARLSMRFGGEIAAPEVLVNQIGYQRLQQNRVPEALELFEWNATRFPGSANVWDSRGEALEAAGQKQRAAESYAKAIEIAKRTGDRGLAAFEAHRARVGQ